MRCFRKTDHQKDLHRRFKLRFNQFGLDKVKPVKPKPNSQIIDVKATHKGGLDFQKRDSHTKKMILKKDEEINTFILLIIGRSHLNFLFFSCFHVT